MQKIVERKVCLLGDWAVGKTSLIRRFVYNAYDDRYLSTLGVKVSRKNMVIKDFKKKPFFKVELTLLLWDLVGQRGFHPLQVSAFKGTNGAFIVCDITRPETIDSMEWWISSLFKERSKVPLIILVNKVDLTEDEVPSDISKKLDTMVEKYDALHLPTSAKTGLNVEIAFQEMGKVLTKKFFE